MIDELNQDRSRQGSTVKRGLAMLALIVAGEAVFFLPFVLPRIFRATMLDVLDLTNLELGLAFSVYGIVAMLAYLPGGPLADLFSDRRLMTGSLVATAAIGLLLVLRPTQSTLVFLYGAWGVSTILLFWSALIRATRYWSEDRQIATAYGLLDGGRGLVAALLATTSVSVFAWLLPSEVESASLDTRAAAFRWVVALFVTMTFVAGLLVWFLVPERDSDTPRNKQDAFQWRSALSVAKLPSVWLQALIVITAYIAYKGLDDLPLYAHEVLGFNEVNSARVGTFAMWLRPVAAISAGIAADKWKSTWATGLCFAGLSVSAAVIANGGKLGGGTLVFFGWIAALSAFVFALRGLYFAIIRESGVSYRYTGTAVGIISTLGYLPDVFMGPLMGYLLDRYPDGTGHAAIFYLVALSGVVGLAATFAFSQLARRSITRRDLMPLD